MSRATGAHDGVDLVGGQAGAFQRVQQAGLDAARFGGDERLELGAGDGLPHVYVVTRELDDVKVRRRQRDFGALDLIIQADGIVVDCCRRTLYVRLGISAAKLAKNLNE